MKIAAAPRLSGEGRNPEMVWNRNATGGKRFWIPAFAGMVEGAGCGIYFQGNYGAGGAQAARRRIFLRKIDVHSHYLPHSVLQAAERGEDWYGLGYSAEPRPGFDDPSGRRASINSPKLRFTPEERIADMDANGTDLQVVSIHTPFFGYSWRPAQTLAMAREVNDEISALARRFPERFAGMATLPAQDVDASIAELERAVNVLGLKGAELDAAVNGENWDEPRFLPLFKAAESLGALLFFHPQPQDNIVALERTRKYALPNSFGVPLEDALVVATLIFGGILEECPNLKACVAHGGGPACFGMGRLDHGWMVRSEARDNITMPPSFYQKRLYYDFLTSSEPALRFLIDSVGADRVVIGSDWPFVEWDPSPGGWLDGLQSLSQDEKEKIACRNLEQLLGL